MSGETMKPYKLSCLDIIQTRYLYWLQNTDKNDNNNMGKFRLFHSDDIFFFAGSGYLNMVVINIFPSILSFIIIIKVFRIIHIWLPHHNDDLGCLARIGKHTINTFVRTIRQIIDYNTHRLSVLVRITQALTYKEEDRISEY